MGLKVKQKFLNTIPGPHHCFFCSLPVTVLFGRGGLSLHLHHIDGNHSNDDPSNWAPAHGSCHNRFHRLGARAEDKTKDKLSKANLGKKLSEETRSKISASLVGNTHTKGRSLTQEHKGKIGNAHSGIKRSDEAKANIRAGILRRRQDVH
jgi:hypothetical protein